MVIINKQKCIGCGACAKDCLAGAIEIRDKKACFLENHNCIECGHCIAVCPQNAVSIDDLDMEEVLDLKDISYEIDSDTYLNHIKARRTIRSYKNEPVAHSLIEEILEAGRFSPTGGNRQNVAYHVYTDKLDELKLNVLEALKVLGEKTIASGKGELYYAKKWIKMYEEFLKDGTDRLYFGAKAVICVSSDTPQAAGIAAAHMETMVYALGLGMLYSGFTTRAAADSQELREYLKLKENYQLWNVLAIGNPAVKYQRTVPRKALDVIWD